jgi:hypothetical protein
MQKVDFNVSKEKTDKQQPLFRKIRSILLNHHPEREKFKNHTIKLVSCHFCIGCFVGYPTAIIGILLFRIFEFYALFNPNTLLLLGTAFLLFLLLSPLNLTNQNVVKIFQKLCIALGSIFLFWWI